MVRRFIGISITASKDRTATLFQSHCDFDNAVWTTRWSCGGTIIGKFWVLTSLNCVASVSNFDAVSMIAEEFQKRDLRWEKRYVSHIFRNEPVALLKSRKQFHHSHIIHFCDRGRPEGTIVSTCGMGRISNYYTPIAHTYAKNLQETHYNLRSRVGPNLRVGPRPLSLPAVFLQGSSICMGDQGGPLYTWNFGRMAPDCLYGVAMGWRGQREIGMDCTQPNYFESVFDVRHWIEQTVTMNAYIA